MSYTCENYGKPIEKSEKWNLHVEIVNKASSLVIISTNPWTHLCHPKPLWFLASLRGTTTVDLPVWGEYWLLIGQFKRNNNCWLASYLVLKSWCHIIEFSSTFQIIPNNCWTKQILNVMSKNIPRNTKHVRSQLVVFPQDWYFLVLQPLDFNSQNMAVLYFMFVLWL